MIKLMKSLLCAGVAIVSTSTYMPNVTFQKNELQSDVQTENEIFPQQPKEVSLDGTALQVSNITLHKAATMNQDTLENLTTWFIESGISIVEDAAAVQVYVATSGDEISTYLKENQLITTDVTALEAEGYTLHVDTKNKTIVIEGKDDDGLFYGIQTLKTIATNTETGISVLGTSIVDEPSMSVRGSIEGFYGTPWTHQDRLDQIKFYGENKLNTYIYAPKDDPYHRENWREPYPESEMDCMLDLINTSKENKVDFVFALSPGNDIRFGGTAGEEDFQALMNKCESLYQMGVRSFAIFFDDIKNTDGVAQASVLNRFNEEFVKAKGDVTPLYTVPTSYWTNGMNDQYTKDFAATLSNDIVVYWTGAAVVPEGIDMDNVDLMKNYFSGKEVGIWWNYPTTDYITDKLALGPISGLTSDLSSEVDMVVYNPMEHASLSKISLASGADYGWNTENYSEDRSFHASINSLYTGEAREAMTIFANHSTRMEQGWASTGREDAPEMKILMDQLIKEIAMGVDTTATKTQLLSDFDAMIAAADYLLANLSEEELSHCRAQLQKMKDLATNDILAVQVFEARMNQEDASELEATLSKNLTSLEKGARVSEKVALAFIKQALSFDPMPAADFSVSSSFVAPGQAVQMIQNSSVSSVDFEWQFPGAVTETSTEANPVVTYTREGLYTAKLIAKNKNGESTLVRENLIAVSNDAEVQTINLSLEDGTKATASSQVSSTQTPMHAIDGDTSTKWCTERTGEQWIRIDLGATKTITNVQMLHAEMGGEGKGLNTAAYRIGYSEDGSTFKDILTISNNTAGTTNDALPVFQARYVQITITKAAVNGNKAIRLPEVEVYGLNETIDLPEKFEAANKTLLNSLVEIASEITAEELENVIPVVVEEFNAALEEATTILADNAANQNEVDASFSRLSTVMQKLEFVKGDKTNLEKLITTVSGLNEKDYRPSTWKDFSKALKEAKVVVKDENAMQEEVNTSYETLVRAFANLRLIPDKSKLEGLLQQADAFKANDYTKESFAVLKDAKKEAKKIINDKDASQEQVTASEANLTNAMKQLEPTSLPSIAPGDDSNGGVNSGDHTSVGGLLALAGVAAVAGTFTLVNKKRREMK
ncbi:hypothetical protein A4S06_01405 [Erysipelotrichaceae bacterium MTC7]|nr:hypothetical protein A4S06_01405 [Erysipelotrichaceae bacterium MTC7]